MDEDISRLKTTALSLLADLGCNGSVLPDDLINEMCRLVPLSFMWLLPFLEESRPKKPSRFIHPFYYSELNC